MPFSSRDSTAKLAVESYTKTTLWPWERGCQNNGVRREVDRWHTYVLTPVNEDVYAKQYENKDAEAQTT